jgi:hypothetical protein
MSVDGPQILASDLAHDVYNSILDLYDAGVSVEEIRERLSVFEDAAFDKVDAEIYLAAAAKAFWEIGFLAPRSTPSSSRFDRQRRQLGGAG